MFVAIPMILATACKNEKEAETTANTNKSSTSETTEEKNTESEKETSEMTEKDEIKKIDPFKDLIVKISGTEGFPEVEFDTSACSDEVQKYVTYEYRTEDLFLNVGEHIIVNAKLDESPEVTEKYALLIDSQNYEVKSEDIVSLYALNSSNDDQWLLNSYLENEWFPTVQQEFVDRMKLPVQTEDGELQVEKIYSRELLVRTQCLLLCSYNGVTTNNSDYFNKNGGFPFTDLFYLLEVKGSVSGSIKETQKQVTNYTAHHYVILHVEFPGIQYGAFTVKNIEFLYTDDIDQYMKQIESDYGQSEKIVSKYIEENFYEKKHSPGLQEPVNENLHLLQFVKSIDMTKL